jgi:hypothetical protein
MDERPIDAPETTEQATIAEPPNRTRTSAPNRTPWLVGGVAVLVLGAGVGIGLGLGGHGSGGSPAASASPTSPATLSMFGSITVPFLGADLFAPQASDPDATGAPGIGDPCITAGGFTDISAGTAVTIGGPDGKTLTVTALEAGRVTGAAGSPAQCTFDFDANVPDNLSEYTVTISHRGTQVFTPEQVRSGGVDLTLNAS